MLADEIKSAQRQVRTDAYSMSIGEIVTMYDTGELIIDPAFQRLFRWENDQKSRLIESLLLGIPLPSIFVFERKDGTWELIDGLQRISTILEFMGRLKKADGNKKGPSILEATKYLPSLHNVVWEKSDQIEGADLNDQNSLPRDLQLAIRRARLGVEILKRPSDDQTKFDLFQRLNAGGTPANAQELRNCVMIMVRPAYFNAIKNAAESVPFKTIIGVTEYEQEKQRHIELAVRFLVHTFIPYDGSLNVEEYIDEGIVQLAGKGDAPSATDRLERTFSLLHQACGANALRRFENGHHSGRVGLVALEVIAVGIASNINQIEKRKDAPKYVRDKIEKFWSQPETTKFTSPGLRGTIRIQRTVPFGKEWFKP